MSPEQITGAPISIAADLYALGVTLFEALTGRLPFLGPDFVAQHLGEPPPLASSVATDIEPGWDELLAALLIKNPRDRTPTLAELRLQLEALDLGNTRITDAGLAHLKGMKKLQRLALVGTGITDAGLANLNGLEELATLELAGTQVKGPGVEDLKKTLSKVKINR